MPQPFARMYGLFEGGQGLEANATRFSSSQNSAKIVGRTPRSARVPLDPLLRQQDQSHPNVQAGPRGPAADRGIGVKIGWLGWLREGNNAHKAARTPRKPSP